MPITPSNSLRRKTPAALVVAHEMALTPAFINDVVAASVSVLFVVAHLE